jgi:4-amino-4-deoxy-L-arabinose transferase-like glycosyltransferase
VIPAYCGAFVLLRRPDLRRSALGLVAIWLVLPPVVLAFSAAQRPSYLYPILPAVAIASAWWIERRWPRAAHVLVRWVLPVLVLCVGVLRIVAPRTLGREHNSTLAREAPRVAAAIPADRPVPSYQVSYWRVANPLVYYARRSLAAPSDSLPQAVRAARDAGGVLMCGPGEVESVRALVPAAEEVARDRDWALVRVGNSPDAGLP